MTEDRRADQPAPADRSDEPRGTGIAQRPEPRRVAIWLGLDTGLRAALSLGVGVAVARHLGPDGYGTLALAVTVVTILGPIGGLGTDSLLVQRMASFGPTSEETRTLLRAAAMVRAAGAAVVVVVAVLFALPHNATEAAAILAVSPALLAAPFEAGWSWIIATGRVRGAVLARVTCSVAFAALRVLAVLDGAGVVWFAALTGVDLLVQAIIAATAAYRQGARFGPGPGHARALLRDSLPLLAGGVFYLMMLRIDIILIDLILGSEETGQYAAVTRFAEAPYLIAIVGVAATTPHIVARHRVSDAGYHHDYVRLLRILVLLAVFAASSLSVLASPLVGLLLGRDFEAAVPALIVLAWTAVPVYLGSARERIVVDLGLTRTTFVNLTAGGVANIGLNLILIPWLGITGAAVATVLAYVVSLVVAPALDRRQRPVNRVLLATLDVRDRSTPVT